MHMCTTNLPCSLVKDAIKEAWVSHMDPAVAMVMRHLEKSMSHNPKDSASLMILAELRDVLTQTLNSECPGFILNRAFQVRHLRYVVFEC